MKAIFLSSINVCFYDVIYKLKKREKLIFPLPFNI